MKEEKIIRQKNAIKNGIGVLCLAGIITGLVGLQAIHEKYKKEHGTPKNIEPVIDSRLPIPLRNQYVVLHPDYLRGTSSIGYTLLTDMDYDGKWDTALKVHSGYPTGDNWKKFYFKREFGPSQYAEGVEMKVVDDNFFEAVEQ